MAWRDRAWLAASAAHHFFTARNPGNLHDPFLRQLHREVIAPARKSLPEFADIEVLRNRWRTDTTWLSITDLGAGSQRAHSSQRTIKEITRHSLSPAWFSRLLALLIRQQEYQHAAELGTSLGLNTQYLQRAVGPKGTINTFEGCPNVLAWAKDHLPPTPPVHTHLGNLDSTWPTFLEMGPTLDLVYLDANHRLEPTIRYFKACLPHLSEKAVVVVDDLYWSRGMSQAWKALKQHPRVRISVDLFEGGLLFFDPSLPKMHVRLRA